MSKKSPAPQKSHRAASDDFVNPHAESNRREIRRIKKIIGQLEGISRMIEDERHCYDVIHQVRATCAALRSLEAAILENHVEHLVGEVLSAANAADRSKARGDLLNLIKGRFVF